MTEWSIVQARPNVVEVSSSVSSDVKYVVRAFPSSLQIEAFEDDVLVETTQLLRGIHEVITDTIDRTGARLYLAMTHAEGVFTTRVLLGDIEFLVESPKDTHAHELDNELKKHEGLPGMELSRRLVEAIRGDSSLRAEISRLSAFGPRILVSTEIDNTINVICTVVCIACAFGSYPHCVACSICVEM